MTCGRWSGRAAGVVAVVFSLAACPPSTGDCAAGATCPPNSVCVVDVCRLVCNSSAVCAAGETCRDGYCAPGALRDAAGAGDRALTDRGRADHGGVDGRASDGSGRDGAVPDRGPAADSGALSDGAVSDRQSHDGVASDTTARDSATGDSGVADAGAIDHGVCGDGEIDPNREACDDHNAVTESCAYGLRGCQVCDENCQWAEGATSYCGDGVVDLNREQCDGSWDCTAECARCPNPPAVDQVLTACTSPPITQCADAFILYQGQSAAQSFTVGTSGALTAVRLRGRSNLDEGNPLLVAVVDAEGNPDALLAGDFDIASHTVASALTAWGPTMGWYEATFAVPPIVSAGQIFYLVVRLVGAQPPPCPTGCWDVDLQRCSCDLYAHWGLYNDWQGATLDSYLGGYAFYCGGTCTSWTREPLYRDHEFETVVTPLCH